MAILKFSACNFRNFKELVLTPNPHINVFFGENAAGKTSLLEAIYYLGIGRSFRSRHLAHVIQHNAKTLILFAELEFSQTQITLGLERSCHGTRRLHVAGELEPNQSIAAKYLPLLYMSADSYRYFYEGPKARRHFLNWGVFHVKHRFNGAWQTLNRILKQRNQGLQQQLHRSQIQVWDIELARIAEQIDEWRQDYVNQLSIILNPLLAELNSQFTQPLMLRYERGWVKDKNLIEVLETHWLRDLHLGYTQAGPQRADLQVYTGDRLVQEVLSQGQQKQLVYSLYLAQGILFKQIKQETPIYLIDDLPAELDPHKRSVIAQILTGLEAQVFVTGIQQNSLVNMFNDQPVTMFHVKHGELFPINS